MKTERPIRRWFQFRLRTLFVLVTLAALVTGVVQHVWFVRVRIGYHQGKVAACEERLAIKVNINAFLIRRISLSRIQSEQSNQGLPSGHLLYFSRGIAVRSQSPDATELIDELERETSRVEEAQRHHQHQLDLYRQATWRPWMRVTEDRSRELPDEPAEAAPTVVIPSPARASPGFEDSAPILPTPSKIRLPWQSIERPLPPAFDERDVQVEKAADA
jgi:hypothetical protein